ncbi:hypothetical protein [Streptomyces sp. 061-3]|uniref:hypothetical protein n=1 Tax=Streptomyces sp. 061-3 TaxID=2789268 RepID=UPI00397E9A90
MHGTTECPSTAGSKAATPVSPPATPALTSGKATIRLRPEDAAAIPEDELRDLARAALAN